MSWKYSTVLLESVLHLSNDPVSLNPATSYPIAGVYSFGRGLFARQPLLGAETTYKIFHRLHADDFVLSQLKGWEGALARVPQAFDGWFLSPQFQTFQASTEKIDINYLEWYCKQSKIWEELKNKSRGMGARRDAVYPNQFLSLAIPLPPLEEQRRIVARIEELAAKIEEARGLRREAMEEADTLISSVIDSLLLSNRWGKKPIGDLLRENPRNGLSSFPSSTPPGIPILRISSATSRDDAVIDEKDYRFLEIDDKTYSKYKVERDDILVCRFNGNLRNVGRFTLYQNYSGLTHIYPDKLIRLRVDRNKVLPQFICLAANSSEGRKGIESFCATTAGNIGISAGSLKTVLIPIPSLAEQEQIINHINSLQSYKNILKQKQSTITAELDALLPSILDRAFKGEL